MFIPDLTIEVQVVVITYHGQFFLLDQGCIFKMSGCDLMQATVFIVLNKLRSI